MSCNSPVTLYRKVCGRVIPQVVPCGRCLACRITRTKEWATRLLYELESWDDASFITLTYDDEHLPLDGSLNKEDLQKFFKRLRRDFDLENRKLKYYACGEYGDKTHRPHYHAIVFGLGLNQHDRQLLIDNWRYCDERRFTVGKCHGSVTVDSCKYTTGYIQKKYSGGLAKEQYGDRLPPFQICSRGLGLSFATEQRENIVKRGYITVNGKPVKVPRYFIKKLDIDTNELRANAIEHQKDYLLKHGWSEERLSALQTRGLTGIATVAIQQESLNQKEADLNGFANIHQRKY